jgi:polysaccharide biosynthesis/export protein
MKFRKSSLRSGLVSLMLGGCASTAHLPSGNETVVSPPQGLASGTVMISDNQSGADGEIARLWAQRTREELPSDLPLGPGDVLEISATPMTELQNYAVRVAGDGMISLPLIGPVRAGGRSEAALEEEIQRLLKETYVREPHVHVFVREYHSRLAAVVGAVVKPGAYSMTRGNDTILEMLSQAGGMTKEAAPRILLFPAESYNAVAPIEVASSSSSAWPVNLDSAARTNMPEPLTISLDDMTTGAGQRYLTLPVRPGDVILVPAGGEVLVDGWVDKPGSYRITPKLTVLGAVSAAGGLKFAADPRAVKVTRAGKSGERAFLIADLEKIKQGEVLDIPVQEGDVIEVASSNAKIVPYGVYSFFREMFRLGATAPLY